MLCERVMTVNPWFYRVDQPLRKGIVRTRKRSATNGNFENWLLSFAAKMKNPLCSDRSNKRHDLIM